MADTEESSYTVDEIAKLLKISKLTAYDLIKKGDLVAYRVGKQMRVDRSDLDAYKNRAKGLAGAASLHGGAAPRTADGSTAAVEQEPHADGRLSAMQGAGVALRHSSAAAGFRPIVITGQDASLDLLARHLEKSSPLFRPLRSFVGSLDGLISLYQGHSDLVSVHLLDGDTGEYNVPYTRKLLVGLPHLVIRLLRRRAGLYVRQGNPLQLGGWDDLARPGLRLVNREQGAGARVLLDEQLRQRGIDTAGISGYDHVQTNHLAVAAKVASGEADAGVGSEKAASMVSGVEFIPLAEECYDLVMLNKPDNRPLIDAVLTIVRSAEFQDELRAMSGYDLTRSGDIIFEG